MAEERERRPWERRSDEQPRHFACFRIYLEMGEGRAMIGTARVYLTSECHPKARTRLRQQERFRNHLKPDRYLESIEHQFHRWARRYEWKARVDAYDAYLECLEAEKRDQEALARREAARAENERQKGLMIEEVRELRNGLQQAVQLALPIALIRIKTAHAELAVLREVPGGETAEGRRRREALIALATKQAVQDATSLLFLASKAYPNLQKAELLNLGEVTERGETTVKAEGLVQQMVAALDAYYADGLPTIPDLSELKQQVGESGNGGA